MNLTTDQIIIAIAVIGLLVFAGYGIFMVLYAKLRWEPQNQLNQRLKSVLEYNRREDSQDS